MRENAKFASATPFHPGGGGGGLIWEWLRDDLGRVWAYVFSKNAVAPYANRVLLFGAVLGGARKLFDRNPWKFTWTVFKLWAVCLSEPVIEFGGRIKDVLVSLLSEVWSVMSP